MVRITDNKYLITTIDQETEFLLQIHEVAKMYGLDISTIYLHQHFKEKWKRKYGSNARRTDDYDEYQTMKFDCSYQCLNNLIEDTR